MGRDGTGPEAGRALPLGWEGAPEPAPPAPRTGEPAPALPGRSRRRLLALGAAVLLVLALALGLPRLLADPAGPEQAVGEFLQAVIDGDVEAVLEHVEDSPSTSGAALTAEILAGAEDRPSSFTIEDSRIAGGTATVTATLRSAAGADTSTFTLTAAPAGAFSPPHWQLEPVRLPEARIVLPVGVPDLWVNGVRLAGQEVAADEFAGAPEVMLRLLPGTYRVAVGGAGRWVQPAEVSFTAPPTFESWRTPVHDLTPDLNDAGEQEVGDQLSRMLLDELDGETPVRWALDAPLELEITHLGGLPWMVHGTGAVHVVQDDARDGPEPQRREVQVDALVFVDGEDALHVQRLEEDLGYTYCIDGATGAITGIAVEGEPGGC